MPRTRTRLHCLFRRGQRRGRRSFCIRRGQTAQHSSGEVLSRSMLCFLLPAPADPTSPPSIVDPRHHALRCKRCAHLASRIQRAWRRADSDVHTPVARSTSCTVDATPPSHVLPPSRCNCPAALFSSFTAMATARLIPPHDSGGSSTNPTPSESISTLEVNSRACISPPSLPPRTTRAPLTAQHECWQRALTRVGMGSHRNVAGLSRHDSLVVSPAVYPPHTTSQRSAPPFAAVAGV